MGHEGHGLQRCGTPLPLAARQSAEALETLEFGAVLELVAGCAVGPLGAERVRGRRPTDELEWIRSELERVSEVAVENSFIVP